MSSQTQYFNEFFLRKALEFKHGPEGNTLDGLLDLFLESGSEDFPIPMKNVCAKLTVELSDQIDGLCSLLEMPKRKFIEMAIINAIGKFEEIAKEYEIYEQYENKKNASEAAKEKTI